MKEIKKELKKEKFDLQECCVCWKNTSGKGIIYLKGHDLHNNKIVGFVNTETNEGKLPKIKIYDLDDNNKMNTELITLWEVKSRTGKTYLSGYTKDNEKVIAFYQSEGEKTPYIKIYFKED